ncbi:hypothetical protein [Halovivax cerinus]|uniref:Uncharacterized protein n=1 Tax=Halovivax cerinus TaxID=1487865 RepID=A0ABD5NKC8_9EURY|nr:hypothetical protein [Halovivax cerinus]
MTATAGDRGGPSRLVALIRDSMGITVLVNVLAGGLAGISLGVVGRETIAITVFEPTSGLLVRRIGLLGAVGVFTQVGCCDGCGRPGLGFGNGCVCSGDCGDRCSYEAESETPESPGRRAVPHGCRREQLVRSERT